jgi:hypothetical protein
VHTSLSWVLSRVPDNPPAVDRPNFPATYGIDRAVRDEMLAWDEARERLTASRNAAPVWGVWMNEALYFSTDPASVKGRNMAAVPDVVVHLESGDDVVIVEGRAERVSDQTTLERMLDAYEQKYAIRFDLADPNFAVYVVRPSTAYAWFEKSFPSTATRWRFVPS